MNNIPLSYSSISTFLDCRHKYYYKYIKGYAPRAFNPNYVTGNFFSLGLYYLYTKKKNPILETMKLFELEKQKLRKKLVLSPIEEQSLNEQDIIIRSMLKAYKIKYKDFIKKTKHIGNEVTLVHTSSTGTKFTGRIDNLLINNHKTYIHEIKTSKYLDNNYIKNIKNSLQVALYFTIYNKLHKDKIDGIIYDVIKKPSIRLKQKESKEEFLIRLHEYYLDPTRPDMFYMEILKKPIIASKKINNLLDKVFNDVQSCKTESDYYHNFNHCFVWNRCEYYDVCFFGENKLNLSKFDIRRK